MIVKRTAFTLVVLFVVTLVVMISGPLSIVAIADTGISATMYLTFVHDGMGFYKVRNLDTPVPRQFTYVDRILNVNLGDTMIWENDADTSTLTILSDQNLWNDQVGRVRVGQKVNYKFDKPGTYTFYIKESSGKRQTIIVSNIGEMPTVTQTPIATATAYPTPVPTTTYKPSATQTRTAIPTPVTTVARSVTPLPSVPKYTPVPIAIPTVPDIKIPVEMTPTSFASIAVATLSIYVTFRRKTGK